MKNTNKDLAAVQPTLESVQLSQVIEQLEQYATSDLIEIYNDYADMNRYERVYDNDEDTINVLFDRAWTAISLSNHDGYKDNDDYFTYNGYGLMSSFNYLSDDNSPIDISELAQWLINEDKLVDYDITVTTVDDMLASIKDSISDDEALSLSLIGYLDLPVESLKDIESYGYDSYNEYLTEQSMDFISDYDYNQLNDIINYLGINYE